MDNRSLLRGRQSLQSAKPTIKSWYMCSLDPIHVCHVLMSYIRNRLSVSVVAECITAGILEIRSVLFRKAALAEREACHQKLVRADATHIDEILM